MKGEKKLLINGLLCSLVLITRWTQMPRTETPYSVCDKKRKQRGHTMQANTTQINGAKTIPISKQQTIILYTTIGTDILAFKFNE